MHFTLYSKTIGEICSSPLPGTSCDAFEISTGTGAVIKVCCYSVTFSYSPIVTLLGVISAITSKKDFYLALTR